MADISLRTPVACMRQHQATVSINHNVLDVSVVLPCLNEAETLALCVREARQALDDNFLRGEIVVADNGSTDGSQAIAESLGARIVTVSERGYGSALRAGIAAAHGEFVIFGDADDSYDFGDIPQFVDQLRDGSDLVMGNRFRGGILPGAMPWLHRYVGNPVLTGVGRLLFGCPVRDFHCGLRGFRRTAYNELELRSTGMEFASEMVIQATLHGWQIAEIPTKLHPDGRSRPPHLRTWRDGWRHLRFMLMCSPRWLFAVPGTLLCGLALLLGLLHGGGVLRNQPLALLAAGILALLGQQLLLYGLVAKRFLVAEGLYPPGDWEQRLSRWFTLERGLVGGVGLSLVGFIWLIAAFNGVATDNDGVKLQQLLPAGLVAAFGVQTAFGSWLLGLLGMFTRRVQPVLRGQG